MRSLDTLFTPRSVAILGASNDETKYGNWISVQALRMRGRRPFYLVNRRGESVLGEPAYRCLADVPEPLPNPVRITVTANETTVVPFQIEVGPSDNPDVEIYAGDYFFQSQPAGDANGTVVAKLGTTICWYNVGQQVHSVTGGPWGDSGAIAPDGNFMWTSNEAGTFPYRCRYHGTQMIATLQIIP